MTTFPTGKPHISFSELKMWKDCSWQHKVQYIDKIDLFVPSPFLDFGTIVHSQCELYLRSRIFDIQKLESEFKQAWEKNNFENVQKWIDEAKQILNDIPGFLDEQFPEWEFVDSEHQLYESIIGQDIKFKGFIDGMIRVKDKRGQERLLLIDWKTSTPRGWDAKKRRDPIIATQLVLYKMFCAKKLEIDLKEIKCGFILLKRGSKPGKACELIEISVGPKTIQNAEKLISSMISSVQKKIFLKNRNSCTYCQYKGTKYCPGSDMVFTQKY